MTEAESQTFVIDSRLEQVAQLGNQIHDLCRQQGMDEMASYQVHTALVEAINNAILHAYANQPGHPVTVKWLRKGDELRFEVVDRGRAMTKLPADIEPPPDAESGRGWWIMRRWMDRVEYSSGAGENRLTLLRRF
jgi:serine/threonine-protein kinase RsbW